MKWWPWRRKEHTNGKAAKREATEQLREAQRRDTPVQRTAQAADDLVRHTDWFIRDVERSLRRHA